MDNYQMILDALNTEYFCKIFSEHFDEWQKEKGMSMGTFAYRIGASDQSIANWRAGKSKPKKVEHFKKICEAFKVEPEIFVPKNILDIILFSKNYASEHNQEIIDLCAEHGLDENFLGFIKKNYEIPRKLNRDILNNMFPESSARLSASLNTKGRYLDANGVVVVRSQATADGEAPQEPEDAQFTIKDGDSFFYPDEADIILLSELQDYIKTYIRIFMERKAQEYERKYLDEYLNTEGLALRDKTEEDRQLTFENIVREQVKNLTHINADEIIDRCEQKFDRRFPR